MININLNGFRYRSKMAGFDYDHTLVKPKTKSTFSKDEDDWMWLRPSVPVMLKTIARAWVCHRYIHKPESQF